MMVGGGSRKMLWRQRGLRVPVEPWYRTIRLWSCGVWRYSITEQAEYSVVVVLFSGSVIGAWWPTMRCLALLQSSTVCSVYSRLSLAQGFDKEILARLEPQTGDLLPE
jgi:hypothetical protein